MWGTRDLQIQQYFYLITFWAFYVYVYVYVYHLHLNLIVNT